MGYRPPAPVPLSKRPGAIPLLFALWRNPLSICGTRHFVEPIVSEKTTIGSISVISAPEGVHHVLVAQAGNYPKDRRQLRILQPGLRTGLLTSSGATWKVARHALAPLFTPSAVEAQTNVMLQCGQRMVQRLSRYDDGQQLDMSAELARVTFDIISSMLFSDETQTDSVEFSGALTCYFNSAGRIDPLDAIGAPHWVPRLGVCRARKAIRFFETLAEKIVARRRADMARGTAPRDLVTLLLEANDPGTGQGLSEADVAGSIITFVGAGHETTANTLAWTLFLLAKHPSVLSAVEAEIDSGRPEDVARWPEQLVLTRAVVNEAMRLYPPAPIMSRIASVADEILGVKIPKGSTVIIAPYIIHRHRRLWEQPDYFRPERFLPGARDKILPYAFLPFGAGPRVCIGQRLSEVEAVIVLATLLRSFRFSLPDDTKTFPVHRVTLRPVPNLMMQVSVRR
jgi:cytochrome P450